jgi:hypothetical protein
MTQDKSIRVDVYRTLYDNFQAPVTRFDCGKHCAPLNNGSPVCCSAEHAVPIVDKWEFELLESRSDLWRLYTPKDADGRKIVEDMHEDCLAVECKGAAFCERDNRSLACRAFPFFPYITRENEIIGVAYFWGFQELCWVINHLELVTPEFVRECLAAYQAVFDNDPEEFKANRDLSADMRRQFTRKNRIIPVIGKDGGYYAVEPRTHTLRPAKIEEFERHGPYKNAAGAVAAE